MSLPSVDVVIPTAGRPSLRTLLEALSHQPPPGRLIVVDDRREPTGPPLPGLAGRVEVLRGPARGPAAARNAGWRASRAEWVAFLDDDVVPTPTWTRDLLRDLSGLGSDVAASQGQLRVPLPAGRRPTDAERGVKGLETARWITANIAYRRSALERLGGFDERFPRAYREDVELGLRAVRSGLRIVGGERTVLHPARPAGPLESVRRQAGNADDALMLRLYGRGWRREAGVPTGCRPRHLLVTTAGAAALAALAAGHRTPAALGAAIWLLGTAEFAASRILPGPRTLPEVSSMLLTSALIPPAASAFWILGLLRARGARPVPGRPEAVLFDRDGTLVLDVPYNGDPERVVPVPGARRALDRLRAAGVAVGVVSNQSGLARGLLTPRQVAAVNRRVEELLGPFGVWEICPHGPEDGCGCRKPAPGLVLRAAARLGADPRRCVVVGDIGADVEAARAAGARAILVPTPATRPEEVAAVPEVVPDLESAVDLVLGGGG
ncbi:haloacid dehalogenase [Rubrobacter xylanophilus]|uniref:D,D-heptose 1,7-bisphosphate phosphatase n=1 Tax=Rubrobacter xylanophilus TaxID=49319 RepID=A0A510HNX1_9ACTN|nr:HAD-IIIA family hydrolase [Rubrobacter xylanophilus]BBL81205.1 haloacid dehalogenase [Rubrobacter xylanophilus]